MKCLDVTPKLHLLILNRRSIRMKRFGLLLSLQDAVKFAFQLIDNLPLIKAVKDRDSALKV